MHPTRPTRQIQQNSLLHKRRFVNHLGKKVAPTEKDIFGFDFVFSTNKQHIYNWLRFVSLVLYTGNIIVINGVKSILVNETNEIILDILDKMELKYTNYGTSLIIKGNDKENTFVCNYLHMLKKANKFVFNLYLMPTAYCRFVIGTIIKMDKITTKFDNYQKNINDVMIRLAFFAGFKSRTLHIYNICKSKPIYVKDVNINNETILVKNIGVGIYYRN
jgi:hypothetical protein